MSSAGLHRMTGVNAPPSGPGSKALGLLVLRASVPEISGWVRSGVVPVTLAPMGQWTAAITGATSLVAAPYDDARVLLAARRLPRRLRPALGFFAIDGRAVITVQAGHRSRVRWVVWEPGRGVVQPPGLEQAGPALLVSAAGGGQRRDVVEILQEKHLPAERILAAIMTVLGLPGVDVVLGRVTAEELDGAIRREPDDEQLGYFETAVHDAVLLRRELEQT